MRKIHSALIIDDDPNVLEAVGIVLGSMGIENIRPAKSAEIALQILDREEFSLIVSDYRLEGMSGIELLERLRGNGNQTPVLLLSGAPDQAGVIRAGQHAGVDFHPKPFLLKEFMGAVDRLAA